MLKLFSKNLNRILIILTILLTGAFLLQEIIYKWINTESTDNAYIDSDISLISPEVNGNIKIINIIENTQVKAGNVIVEIEDLDFKARLEQAKALLQIGENAIYVTEYSIKLENLNLQKLEESLSVVQTELDGAEKEYTRTLSLSKDQYTSTKLLDVAKTNYEKAKFAFKKTKLDIESSEYNITSLTLKKSTEIANLASLSESVKLSEKALRDTKLTAPVNGIVTNIAAKIGNYASIGNPIFAIVQTDKKYIKANFKETQLRKIKPGMKVEIKIDAIPNKKFVGIIRSFSPATGSKFSLIPAENSTGNFTKVVQRVPVTIDFETPDEYKNLSLPGMSAIISVPLNQ